MLMRVIVLLICLSQPALAQDNRLVGTWKLVAWVAEIVDTKERVPLYGEAVKGRIVFSLSGRVTAVLTGADRKLPDTIKDEQEAFRSMAAYSGRYRIDGDNWITDVDATWNEHFAKTPQVRHFHFEDSTLVTQTEPVERVRNGRKVMARNTLIWVREE